MPQPPPSHGWTSSLSIRDTETVDDSNDGVASQHGAGEKRREGAKETEQGMEQRAELTGSDGESGHCRVRRRCWRRHCDNERLGRRERPHGIEPDFPVAVDAEEGGVGEGKDKADGLFGRVRIDNDRVDNGRRRRVFATAALLCNKSEVVGFGVEANDGVCAGIVGGVDHFLVLALALASKALAANRCALAIHDARVEIVAPLATHVSIGTRQLRVAFASVGEQRADAVPRFALFGDGALGAAERGHFGNVGGRLALSSSASSSMDGAKCRRFAETHDCSQALVDVRSLDEAGRDALAGRSEADAVARLQQALARIQTRFAEVATRFAPLTNLSFSVVTAGQDRCDSNGSDVARAQALCTAHGARNVHALRVGCARVPEPLGLFGARC